MFVRTARTLEDSPRTALVAGAAALVLLGAWMVWFLFARVSVYEVSQAARVEVDTSPHQVDAPVSGRVIKTSLALDREVRAGEVLVELESDTLRLERDAEATRLSTLVPQLEALRLELGQEESALLREDAVAAASLDEMRARQRGSGALARLKAEEQSQLEALRANRAVADVEANRMMAESQQKTAETEAIGASIGRLGQERGLRRSERRAKLARIEQELARFDGERQLLQAKIRVYDQEIALRVIRAPIAGRLGDIVNLRPGSVVEAGTRLAVIVPQGTLRAVALYDPATSVGRISQGQVGRLRLHGFPWTKYGSITAMVHRVGNEPKEGQIRVELTLRLEAGSHIPLQHGLSGTAEIEVERVSPASLVLDAAGRYLTRANQPSEPKSVL